MSHDEHGDMEDHMKLGLLARAHTDFQSHVSQATPISNYFRNAEWTPDGTCLITNSADNHIRTFVVPPELLEERDAPLDLEAYSSIPSFEPVNALVCYPHFSLQNSSTTLVLSAASEHPIRLSSALTGQLAASYPLISTTTEKFLKPQSLVFTSSGSHFLAGSNRLISTFDVSRPGEEPLTTYKTGPKNAKSTWSNPATSLQGLVSALAIDEQYNVLTAGTLSRQVGLYDSVGQGECVGVFSVAGTEASDSVCGSGITQLTWSTCGKYLYIAERKSDGFLIYDIRRTGQLLSWSVGRGAMTNQRMKIEMSLEADRNGIWAGSTNGYLNYWAAPHLQEGAVQVSWRHKAHADAVNSVSMHGNASVLATAAGQRSFGVEADRENMKASGQEHNQLKLWQISPAAVLKERPLNKGS